jgi:diguanylate cyclase (GGDEF)-like protein
MKFLSSIDTENFRKLFLAFFFLSSLLPLLILILIVTYRVVPHLPQPVIERLRDSFFYGLIAMLFISLLAFCLLFQWIRSLERMTARIKRSSAPFLNETLDFAEESELRTLQKIFENLVKELQSKMLELDQYSNRLIESNVKLSEMAMKDKLTDLYNRRSFDARIAEETSRCQRYGHALSLMMIDIDDFKRYNDLNGHQAGDRLLQDIAVLICSGTRKSDICFRYGGDELAIILPEAGSGQALHMAAKISQSVAAHPFKDREKQPIGRITVSIGVAPFQESVEQLVGDTDRYLYQAKSAGKGMVKGPDPNEGSAA